MVLTTFGDETPSIGGDLAVTAAEGGAVVVTTADLTATDPDTIDEELIFTVTAAAHGTVRLNGAATTNFTKADLVASRISFQHDGGELDGSFSISLSDGIAQGGTASVGVAVDPHANDAPVNALPGTQQIEANVATAIAGVSITDSDAGAGALTTVLAVEHGTLTLAAAGGAGVSGSGTSTVSVVGTLAAINATLTSLSYTGNHDFFGTDALTMVATDGGNSGSGGPLIDADKTLIQVGHQSAGGVGDDDFTAPSGSTRFDAGAGIDTIRFDFRLTDAAVTWSGNKSSSTVRRATRCSPASRRMSSPTARSTPTTAIGWSTTCSTTRATRMCGRAHVDADAHYSNFGWHEWRDPNAFFSTSFYLAVNADVKAAGINPLTHFAASGWRRGAPAIAGVRRRGVPQGQSRPRGRTRRSARALPPARSR